MTLRSSETLGWAPLTALGLALAACADSSSAAERPWLEIKTPHFVVVANTGEGTARDVGWQFEQVHYVFKMLWPWARRESGRPFVVFAVRSSADMKALAPHYWEIGRDDMVAVAASGADKDYVALQAGVSLRDDLRTNPYFFAYWGYANRVLSATFPVTLPPWYQRGLSDLFGNTLVRGKDVHVGRLIRHHLERLGESTRVPLREVFAADWQSKYVTDEGWIPLFDAEAWIFVHYLVFGEKGAHQPKFNRFAELMRQGGKPDVSFLEAFGPMEPLTKGFSLYVGRNLYGYATIKADLNVKPEGFAVRALAPAAAAALRAGFHVAMDRPREARVLLGEARRAEPSSLLATEAEALLLDRENKREEALAAYARASDGGSDNFYVYYRRASLVERDGAAKETLVQLVEALEQAVRLNPDHASSRALLAWLLKDLGPADRAVEEARKAVSLEPSVASHRLALVGTLWKVSRADEARREARAALGLASDEEERRNAQEWIDSMQSADGSNRGVSSSSGEPSEEGDWVPRTTEACEAGAADACAALAAVHLSGSGVTKDPARAVALFEKACDLSALNACAYAASLKFEGRAVPKNLAGASTLATKACDGGALKGCTTLALIHASRSTAQDQARARELLTKACNGGEADACKLLKSFPN